MKKIILGFFILQLIFVSCQKQQVKQIVQKQTPVLLGKNNGPVIHPINLNIPMTDGSCPIPGGNCISGGPIIRPKLSMVLATLNVAEINSYFTGDNWKNDFSDCGTPQIVNDNNFAELMISSDLVIRTINYTNNLVYIVGYETNLSQDNAQYFLSFPKN